jgi:hypothetical protein
VSFKRWFIVLATVGQTVGLAQTRATSPINGSRVIGLEDNFSDESTLFYPISAAAQPSICFVLLEKFTPTPTTGLLSVQAAR